VQAEIRHPDGTTITKRFRTELQANDWLEVQRSHSLAVADTTMRLEEWMEACSTKGRALQTLADALDGRPTSHRRT
jgi:hypothetical protein